jgi:hypothetical protein
VPEQARRYSTHRLEGRGWTSSDGDGGGGEGVVACLESTPVCALGGLPVSATNRPNEPWNISQDVHPKTWREYWCLVH